MTIREVLDADAGHVLAMLETLPRLEAEDDLRRVEVLIAADPWTKRDVREPILKRFEARARGTDLMTRQTDEEIDRGLERLRQMKGPEGGVGTAMKVKQ